MKTKIFSYLLPLTSLLFLFTSCIEEYEADIAEEDSNLLVVEGTIRSSQWNVFILTRTQSINAIDLPQRVEDAEVCVRGTDGSEYRANGVYGVYICEIDDLIPDVEYYLHIETDGEVYESEPQKPLPTEKIAEVTGVQNTPEGDIDVLITPEAPLEADKARYYLWTYNETWEVHADYTTNVYYDTELQTRGYQYDQFPEVGWIDQASSEIIVGASLNYEGQHIRRLKVYDLDCTDERMYHRYSGLIEQRAITKAEYEYELARRQAGSEMGGLFTPQPSALPTNIRCLTSDKRVIGYVGCSLNTSAYRFFLTPGDYTIPRRPDIDTRVWLENPTVEDCLRMVRKGLFLCIWDTTSGPGLKTAWAYQYQLDVRTKGAYLEEPDFWSLTENVSY